MLQVEFEGPLESGIGSGVHVSFFTDAAGLLESWLQNCQMSNDHGMPMWICDSETRDMRNTDSSAPLMCELYPHSLLNAPQHVDVKAVCRRFSLLGWLFAKALMDQQLDERLLPLRLNPLFIDMVLGRLRLAQDGRRRELSTHLDDLPFAQMAASQIKGGTAHPVCLFVDERVY